MTDSAGMSIRSHRRMSTPPRLLESQSSLVHDPTDLNRGSVSTTRDRVQLVEMMQSKSDKQQIANVEHIALALSLLLTQELHTNGNI